MAKKKESGNLGLIVTLVFFVLSTVILGVTTYLGFSQHTQKDAEVKKAIDDKNAAEGEVKWRKFQVHYARAMFGDPEAGVDPGDLAEKMKLFKAGQLSGKDDFDKFQARTNEAFPWDYTKSNSPPVNVKQFIAAKAQEVDRLKNERDVEEKKAKRIKSDSEEEAKAYETKLAAANKANEDLKRKSADDRKKDLDDINDRTDKFRTENERANKVAKELEEATKELEKLRLKTREQQRQVADLTKKNRLLTEENEDKRSQLAAALEKTGLEARTVESQVQDARAAQALKEWKNNWQIVQMDKAGAKPYINLGTSDNIQPQVTFSIHSVGLDGKSLNPIPKGTAEVVRVVGTNLSQVRITSVRDAKKDPIVIGDRLFNPTWDPNRKKHVAIAGLADMGSDGNDNTDELRRLLGRQNVEIDAYIDVKDDKGPKLMGKGVTNQTDYLILADNLDTVGHPRARDKDYVAKYEKVLRDLKETASANGVTVVSLKKYLEMIGYKSPRIGTAGQGIPNR